MTKAYAAPEKPALLAVNPIERFRMWLESARVSQAELARQLGRSRQYIGAWLYQRIRRVPRAIIEQACNVVSAPEDLRQALLQYCGMEAVRRGIFDIYAYARENRVRCVWFFGARFQEEFDDKVLDALVRNLRGDGIKYAYWSNETSVLSRLFQRVQERLGDDILKERLTLIHGPPWLAFISRLVLAPDLIPSAQLVRRRQLVPVSIEPDDSAEALLLVNFFRPIYEVLMGKRPCPGFKLIWPNTGIRK